MVIGTFTLAAAALASRAGQRRLRVLHRHLVVPRVQLGDRVARLHQLVLVHIHLDHLARNARADLDQVAVDLRVVGVFGRRWSATRDRAATSTRTTTTTMTMPLRRDCGCATSVLSSARRLAAVVVVFRHVYFPPRYFL